MTARDFAKLGELFRNKGNWKGQQIISADWVERATRWDAPHLEPGKVEVGGKNGQSAMATNGGYQMVTEANLQVLAFTINLFMLTQLVK